MLTKFGTSGLRGLVEDLVNGASERYVTGFASHLLASRQAMRGDPVFIGYDLRPSSPQIAGQAARMVQEKGLVAIDCGDISTPALADYAMGKNAASIMITGSHIPDDRNGIKFYLPSGEITKQDELAITEYANHLPDIALDYQPVIPVKDHHAEALSSYCRRYEDVFEKGQLSGFKLGFYEHSSVVRNIFKQLLEYFGAEVISLGWSDRFIPVDTEAVSCETRNELVEWSKQYQLDAIISTDGDGDRPLLTNEKGLCIPGDILGFICAQFISADVIVTPVNSNSGFESAYEADIVRTSIGSPYVIEAMISSKQKGAKAIAAFEANGGFFLGSDIKLNGKTLSALPTRDSFLPILAALLTAQIKKEHLSELVSGLKLPVTDSGRIENLPTERSTSLIERLEQDELWRDEFFAPFGKIASINLKDGLRVSLQNGSIIHLRPSGNAPEMRCYVEAKHSAQAQALLAGCISHIQDTLNL